MKLHIGAGERYLSGYKHLDIIERPHIDIVSDVRSLPAVADESVDEIYASHILEHFRRWEVDDVLSEWARVLKRGGILRLAVPDFSAIVEEYTTNRDLDLVLGLLYGGQNYDYNYHFQAYDFSRLEKLLHKAGFNDVKRYDWKTFLPADYDDFSKAYLPHLDFENGRLMSLNVIAIKG